MKSFVAILVISSLAIALSQSTCTVTGAASCATNTLVPTTWTAAVALTTGIPTSCNSGYVLVNTTSSCVACAAGCNWCYNATTCAASGCGMGYAPTPAAGACISCSAATTGYTGNVANAGACTLAGTVITVTSCASGYTLLNATCISCTAGGTPTGGVALTGVASCTSCSTAVIAVSSTTPSAPYITCTGCASGFSLVPLLASKIYVPYCTNTSIAGVDTIPATSGNLGSAYTTYEAGCMTANLVSATTGFDASLCLAPNTGYWCSTAIIMGGSGSAAACFNTGVTNAPSTCTAGTTTATGAPGTWGSTTFTCTACTTATNQIVAGACVAPVTNCLWMTSATLCGVAAPGYHVPAAGSATPVACAAGACSSLSCASGSYLNATGVCATGTGMTNCLLHNTTSNCVLCAPGYATSQAACQACSASCTTCTSATTCTACAANFVVSNASCVAAPAPKTSNGKALLSGLAFISMIFYYIL